MRRHSMPASSNSFLETEEKERKPTEELTAPDDREEIKELRQRFICRLTLAPH